MDYEDEGEESQSQNFQGFRLRVLQFFTATPNWRTFGKNPSLEYTSRRYRQLQSRARARLVRVSMLR